MVNYLNSTSQQWFHWQWAMLWQTAVLIAIIWLLDMLIRKWAHPQLRYALWMLILVKLLIPPTWTSPASVTSHIPGLSQKAMVSLSSPPAKGESPEGGRGLSATPASVPHHPQRRQDAYVPLEAAAQGSSGILPKSNMPTEPTPNPAATVMERADASTPSLSWQVYPMLIWLAGIIILSTWLIVRLSSLRREHQITLPLQRGSTPKEGGGLPERFHTQLQEVAQKLNLKRIPRVVLTDKVACPAVFGIFRPVLLMPAAKFKTMTRQDTEHILLHELAHIKRGDLLVHAVWMLVQIVYWFNPLLWMIRRTLQNLRELCCDATVAKLLKENTVHYRETLLETARQLLAEPVDPGLGLLGLFENNNWLVTRLHWLEKNTWKNRRLRIATIIALVAIMTACVLPMANAEKQTSDSDGWITKWQGNQDDIAIVDMSNGSIGVGNIKEKNGGVEIDIYDTYYKDHECRIIAISKWRGKIYVGELTSLIKPDNARFNKAIFEDIPLKKIKEFKFQIRPIAKDHFTATLPNSGDFLLTEHQREAVMPVFTSLADELEKLVTKYTELAEYRRSRAIAASMAFASGNEARWIELSYQHNFTAPKSKRGIQTSDFGEHGFYFIFKCLPISSVGAVDASEETINLQLRNLGVWLYANVKTGLNPSPGLIEEVYGLLQVYFGKLEEIDKQQTEQSEHTDYTIIEKTMVDAIQKSLPNNYFITKKEENSSPFYLEEGNGIALYITNKDVKYVKQQYSNVVWLMPKDYTGTLSQADQSPHQVATPALIAVTQNFKIYSANGPSDLINNRISKAIKDTEKELTQNPEHKTNNYSATLSNGVTVELLGVCNFDLENQQCWQPDGNPINEPLFVTVSKNGNKQYNTKAHGFIVKTAIPCEIQWLKASGQKDQFGYSTVVDKSGKNIGDQNYYGRQLWLDGREQTDLTIEVAPEKWQTKATYDGKYIIGQADERVRFIETYDSADGLKVVFQSDLDDMDIRLDALVKGSAQSIVTAEISTVTDSDGNKNNVGIFKGMGLSQIRNFQFKIRPKMETVTFKNVSLKPNYKTDVQIEIQNPSLQIQTLTDKPPVALDLDNGQTVIVDRSFPPDYDIGWDNDEGGVLMSNPAGSVKMIPITDVQNFEEAVSKAIGLKEHLLDSGLRGVLGKDARYILIRTSEDNLVLLEITEFDETKAIVKWKIIEESQGNPVGYVEGENRNLRANLPPELIEKRNKLLAEADEKIRLGLIELADKFSQLKKANGWARIVSERSKEGSINIALHHTDEGKIQVVKQQSIPEMEQLSVWVVVLEPFRELQIGVGYSYPNIGLGEHITIDAGNPELETELRNLVKEALELLQNLNQSLINNDAQVNEKQSTVWGQVVGGLRAAVEFMPEKGCYSFGEKIGIQFKIQNLSDKTIILPTTTWRFGEESKCIITNRNGETIPVNQAWFSGLSKVDRHEILPDEVVTITAASLMLFADDSNPEANQMVGYSATGEPDNYSIHFELKFPDIISKGADGNTIVPLPNDWQGMLITGMRNLCVKTEGENNWGDAVEGLQCRLQIDSRTWQLGDEPELMIDFRNVGNTGIPCPYFEQLFEIEYDGQWFKWTGPITAEMFTMVLKPNQDTLQWFRPFQIKLPTSWASKDSGVPLKLTPGKHTLRVKVQPLQQGLLVSDPVPSPVTSNPVEIEITESVSLRPGGETEVEIESQSLVSSPQSSGEKREWVVENDSSGGVADRPQIAIEAKVFKTNLSHKILNEYLNNELGVDAPLSPEGLLCFTPLTDAQGNQLEKWMISADGTSTLSSPKVRVFDGEKTQMSLADTQTFTTGYENDTPKVEEITTGTQVEFTPTFSEEEDDIQLAFSFKDTAILDLLKQTTDSGKEFVLPTTETTSFHTSISIPQGKTMLIPVAGTGGMVGMENAPSPASKNEHVFLLIKTELEQKPSVSSPKPPDVERKSNMPDGALVMDVVNEARDSENWIHEVDSFYLKVENSTSNGQPGMMEPMMGSSLPETGTLEFAFDQNRVRFLCDGPRWYQLMIWNGSEVIGHEKSLQDNREFYYFDNTRQNRFKGFISSWTSWLRSQPHSFWFNTGDDVRMPMSLFGQAKDFYYIETTQYQDTDCFVVGCDTLLSDMSVIWFIGVDDGLLYGIRKFKGGVRWIENWMNDYREVAPGCRVPFEMGSKLYRRDDEGTLYLDSQRELKVVQCTVNQKLSDDLFKIDFKDGVTVNDHRFDHFISYPYKANRTQQEFQELLNQTESSLDRKRETPLTEKSIQTITFKKDMQRLDALQALAKMYKVNIIPSDAVGGYNLATELFDVTFEEALKAVCGTTHTYEIKDNFVYVYTNEEYAPVPKEVTLKMAKKAIPAFFAERNKNVSECTILELGELTTRDDGTKAVRCKCELKTYNGDTEIFDAMFFFDKTGNVSDILHLQEPVKHSAE